MKILDCTIRDGGYYTNWDFSSHIIDNYIESLNNLPIDYIEIGYRSKPLKGYLGKFFYLPITEMKSIKARSNKKLALMLNEKDVRINDANELLNSCKGLVDMIRLAVDPKNIERAIKLARDIKNIGFEVAMNLMYMSKWKENEYFLEMLSEIDENVADYFYMVDSYGGVYPSDIKEIYLLVRSKMSIPIGFHGHNNLEMALINTLTAIDCGVDIVDATITGMGRGAGNLKTELLLTALNAQNKLKIDYNSLSRTVDDFSVLQNKYEWGTNLSYMVSGANSLPQKKVMEWVSKRYYSLNSIIRALTNISQGKKDNRNLPKFNPTLDKNIYRALVIGGGPSVKIHAESIKEFLNKNPDILVIHASSKNAMSVQGVNNNQIYCLVGNEGYRLEKVFGHSRKIEGLCVLPPFPRSMGTYIPKVMEGRTFELEDITFNDRIKDSNTTIALQILFALDIKEVSIVGYDGYFGENLGQKEQELLIENEYLFSLVKEKFSILESLSPTVYDNITKSSVYSKL